jgi:BirA family transcriptional regulator, biotin operon repressor / biotin---[acetyl-CoA-carboxylase] ligase
MLLASELPGRLESRMPGRWSSVEWLPSVDSTNRHLLDRDDLEPGRYHVCVAREQTAGRGRRGRTWISRPGQSLTFSLARALGPDERADPGLTLAAGVGLARGLSECGFRGHGLKWPNDLVTSADAKLAGILVEARGAGSGGLAGALVVGVGMNLSGAASLGLERDVADLAALDGPVAVTLVDLLVAVLPLLVLAWEDFRSGGLAPFVEDFRSLDRLRGRRIEVLETGQAGQALGIDPADGALLLESDRDIVRLYSGDVSVRAPGHG